MIMWRTAACARNQTGFVGAGIMPAVRKGTHEGCPYKRRKSFYLYCSLGVFAAGWLLVRGLPLRIV
jgi:hypothetical protein